jgi:CheY-like chemotaxis protein
MILAGRPAKILLIDTNVYFSKRLSDALKREGFEVNASTQPAFALTTLEYDAPSAIVCSTNMREMGALDIARMIRADAKNAALPVIALGDGSQRALMEAFQAGCDDYIDRTRPPAVIATHIRNIIVSKAEGFQPTQMLAQSDTSLSGSLTHHDLPGVMQMLGHAHQTGALHINAGDIDALLFFDAGTITHAECGALFGDEAVINILKNCFQNNSGVYKFVYGSSSSQRTVLRSATDLMLDAMREVDESCREPEVDLSAGPPASDADAFVPSFHESADTISSEPSAASLETDPSPFVSSVPAAPAEQHVDDALAVASLVESSADEPVANESECPCVDESSADLRPDDSEVIASLIDRYAASPWPNNFISDSFHELSVVSQPDDSTEVESLIERPALAFQQPEPNVAEDHPEASLFDDNAEAGSRIELPAITPSVHQPEPGFVEEDSEPSLLDDSSEVESLIAQPAIAPSFFRYENSDPSFPGDSSEVESLIERPAIMHSNHFSAAIFPDFAIATSFDQPEVAPSSDDSAMPPEENCPGIATPENNFEFSAAPEEQAEAEPKVDLSAVVDQVFHLAVTPEADQSAVEPDANRPADTTDKESL